MAFKSPGPIPGQPALHLPAIIRGSAMALALSLIGILLLGITYHFTGLMESTLPLFATVILLVSVFVGGFSASRQSGGKGLFHGLGVGMVIFLLIWVLMGVLLPAGVAFTPLMQKFFICLIGGSLGGIAGILF
ncbi:MAG: TIGR04086 family membrane protein [Peptococcaceae bacterium]|nr:TIGR04086 family membrane protein [Peptococcaceae bacterium]